MTKEVFEEAMRKLISEVRDKYGNCSFRDSFHREESGTVNYGGDRNEWGGSYTEYISSPMIIEREFFSELPGPRVNIYFFRGDGNTGTAIINSWVTDKKYDACAEKISDEEISDLIGVIKKYKKKYYGREGLSHIKIS